MAFLLKEAYVPTNAPVGIQSQFGPTIQQGLFAGKRQHDKPDMHRAAGPADEVSWLKKGVLGEGAARTSAGNLDLSL
jgi:hypothetical protein